MLEALIKPKSCEKSVDLLFCGDNEVWDKDCCSSKSGKMFPMSIVT